ncbi:hypothetical protein MKK50_15295 [Methylobacterium sp. J-043]|nr:hypothetical protein [Methylobacterium sp. J-043]
MAKQSRPMGFYEVAALASGMLVLGVYDRPRVKRHAVYLGAIPDGVEVGGQPFDLAAHVEEQRAEMLTWAREHGGKLRMRRVTSPPFIRGRGQPRSGMTVAAIVFDRPEMAFWFKMRWA